jgi:two-component system sensor histidine kinase UhpB
MAPLSTTAKPGRFMPGAGTPARSDLRWVAVATMLAYLLASTFELSEWLTSRTAPFEVWQLDELPLTVAILSLGLAWYGWRRWRDCARLLSDNRELARQLIAVQERERIALARELHDELAQDCTSIRIEAAFQRRARDAEAICAAAERAADAASRLLDGLRGVLRKLRPAELDELGLAPALLSLVTSHEKRSGARCDLVVEGSVDGLGPTVDIAIYRVVQEALSNVARHAQARQVSVTLTRAAEMLSLRIRDDGCGFDPTARTCGVGLLGMTERAAAVGARVVTSTAPGAGTALCMTIPLRQFSPRPRKGV